MRKATDPMAPEASPITVSKPSGVRRVNNLPMILMGGVFTAFLLIMALVAVDRATPPDPSVKTPNQQTGSTALLAHEIAGASTAGIVAPSSPEQARPPPAPVDKPVPMPKRGQGAAPLDPVNAGPALEPPANDDALHRLREAKLQRLEAAAKARTAVPVVAPQSARPPPTREAMRARLAAVRQQIHARLGDDPTTVYHARLGELRGRAGGARAFNDATSPTLLGTAGGGGNDAYANFNTSDGHDRWTLDAKPQAPRTPYTLRAGFVIPATLISGISADLPGQIMAQVAQNVYDTPTGNYLLIPQGARLVGRYASDVAYGQSRVLVAWQRIVFPDGKALDIGAMPGADRAGYAGFHDQVNRHYLRMFGSALLMSAVVAGITLSQDRERDLDGGRQRASDALSEALGQQLGQVTAQMIAQNLNVAPTLAIRPGYRFNVLVTKDLTFSKPYQAFDYNAPEHAP